MNKHIKLEQNTLRKLQKYIELKIKERGFEDESLHERLLLLVEEIGELVKACRKESNMNVKKDDKSKGTIGEEITDVINLTFAVGIKLGLDIEKEFLDKEKIIDKRTYSRSKKE